MPEPTRFRDRDVVFSNGSRGQNLDIPSANPGNYHPAISRPHEMPRVAVDGKLFLPPVTAGKRRCHSSSSFPEAWASPPRTSLMPRL